MSSPSNTPMSSTAASIDSASPRRQAEEPWLPEPKELPNTPWYEEKSSNLKLSDIATIKEKGGTMEMSLRFPIPRFITALCHYIKVSPSQLAPNSYSFLLALAILLSYHKFPLIPYVLMQLVQIKRLGPGKFYLSHKGDHTFIKGNPSSHKGWMSRLFYIKCDSMRDPWRCEMHWRDNVFILSPRTPDRTPSLTPFLEAMRDERMGRAELLRAMQEEAHASGEVGPPKKATKKRKAPSSTETEVHRERRKKSVSPSGTLPEETQERSRAQTPPTATPEKTPDTTPIVTIAEASSSRRRYICNMSPDPDLQVLMKADDTESTRSVLGKCVCLVTLAMSLFDLQDVCMAIRSIATLDLPMVVDLIGIYGLKGPYCTLTTTNWFLQALSVIPRGSWGDVARRFTMIRWAETWPPPLLCIHAAAAARLRRKIVSGQFDEENPFVMISSVLLVQADEGFSFLVVDRIGDIYRNLPRRADVIVTTVGARHKCQQVVRRAVVAGLLVFRFEEKSDIVGIQMSPSVFSEAGVGTSSLDKLERQRFGLAEETQLESGSVGLLLLRRFVDVSLQRLLEAGEVCKDISLV
ncbi:hypothetical protein F511_37377 [Dorcoceras hygrometricum]|uniref:Uncharacterized protein n=1 Tax=Dorcoceras hygrometricum TaxID=472368 RepID=A0A2Z7CTM1_9LAMI|nr:hypothetical protein F511_37377 [Dorcoceras hygrometricum]